MPVAGTCRPSRTRYRVDALACGWRLSASREAGGVESFLPAAAVVVADGGVGGGLEAGPGVQAGGVQRDRPAGEVVADGLATRVLLPREDPVGGQRRPPVLLRPGL